MKPRPSWLQHTLGIQIFLLSLSFFFIFSNAYVDCPLSAMKTLPKGLFLYGVFLFFSFLAIWWKARVLQDGIAGIGNALDAFAQGRSSPTPAVSPIREVAELQLLTGNVLQEMQHAMARLHRENHEMDLVLSTLQEGVVLLDEEDRITRMNRQAALLFGVSPSKSAGRLLVEVFRNLELNALLNEKKQETAGAPRDIATSGGRVLQFQVLPIRNATGMTTGRLLVFEDVTALRSLESMRRDFSANVSHELKTPITSILGFLETLRDPDSGINGEDRDRYLEIAARQAQRMNAIIEDLLQLSRIEALEPTQSAAWESVRIADIVESAIHMCEKNAGAKSIRIHAEFSEKTRIPADASLLEQAVLNILDNAIKYSNEGTGIRVTTEETEDDVRIHVQDRGIGIPAADLPHIFERFYRVDKGRSRAAGGTGLGLSIAHHILRMHCGRIDVQSAPGAGSTFSLILPKNDNLPRHG